jgi:hypothetical protein
MPCFKLYPLVLLAQLIVRISDQMDEPTYDSNPQSILLSREYTLLFHFFV